MGGNSFNLGSALNMSLREKIAQLMLVRIGSNLPPVRTVEQDEERIAKLLDACPVSGLLLFNGGPDTKQVLKQLQDRSHTSLLIASDIERGVGQQVKGYTIFPHAMAFGKMDEAEGNAAVVQFAGVLAQEARDVGVHITFGPVADVSTNPQNPIIATRAFSDEVERASQLVARFVDAVQARGLLATAKHFPGHGDTSLDSHADLPVVTHSRERLKACELQPFQSAIDAGCALIMTAHVAFPALDSTGVPATLSPAILQGLLRDEMGFTGVVCSDSLLMAGVRERFESESELARAALLAGVDMLLDVYDPQTVVDDLCKYVADGSLPASRIDEAFSRVGNLRSRRVEIFPEAPMRKCAESIARRAIQFIGPADRSALPFVPDKPLSAILFRPFESPLDPPEQPLAAALRERFTQVRYTQLGPSSDAAAYQAAEESTRQAAQILIAVVVRPAAWHKFGLLPSQIAFIHKLLGKRRSVLASLGVPQILLEFPEAAGRVCAYSDVPVSQRALTEFLLARPASC